MIKAFNMTGDTCHATAKDFDSLKVELDKLNGKEANSSTHPVLIYEQDEDSLQRPIFQKIHIAHYQDGWKIK